LYRSRSARSAASRSAFEPWSRMQAHSFRSVGKRWIFLFVCGRQPGALVLRPLSASVSWNTADAMWVVEGRALMNALGRGLISVTLVLGLSASALTGAAGADDPGSGGLSQEVIAKIAGVPVRMVTRMAIGRDRRRTAEATER
jgi:hypothetical protein